MYALFCCVMICSVRLICFGIFCDIFGIGVMFAFVLAYAAKVPCGHSSSSCTVWRLFHRTLWADSWRAFSAGLCGHRCSK